MDNKYIGAYHFSDNPALYEPQRNNTFQFVVPNIGRLLKPGAIGESDADYISGDTAKEMLTLSVVKATIPNFEISPVEIRRGNSVMKAAGLPSFPSGDLVVRDFIGADPLSILQAWQRLAYNPDTQLIGHMSDYKRDCYLLQYDVDYSKVVHQWLLRGCWVNQISQDPVDVESGDARLITATIQYDSGKIILPDEI